MKVKYKNWSINKKLLSISLSAFLPMVILAAYLIVSLNNAASAYSEITKSIAYANRYVKDFKSRLDYSVYLAVVSNKQLKEVGWSYNGKWSSDGESIRLYYGDGRGV